MEKGIGFGGKAGRMVGHGNGNGTVGLAVWDIDSFVLWRLATFRFCGLLFILEIRGG